MKTYPKCKDSGIKWLEVIPDTWTTPTVGKVCKLGRGRVISNIEISENPGGYPVYSSQTSNNGVLGYLSSYDFEGEYVTWTTDGANAGRVFFRSGKFNCTNVCGTMIPTRNDVFLPYLFYLLNILTPYYVRLDINPKLMNDMMSPIKICFPPLPEQNQIAKYLDHKTTKIDFLIEKKNRLIELFKEERTAVINQTVTKGLDSNVPMKDSGIEWLGKIPEHWEVKRLKYLSDVVLGKMLTPNDKGGYHLKPYLRAKNLTWLKVDAKDIKEMWFSETELKQYRLFKDDLLVSEGGEVGRTCIWNGEILECYIQNSVNRVRFYENMVPRYFLYLCLIYGYKGHFDAVVSKVSIAHLTKEKLIDIFFVVPPFNEQEDIVKFIENDVLSIDHIISKSEIEIELLQEYRTALISEVVTGKIDVREEKI